MVKIGVYLRKLSQN